MPSWNKLPFRLFSMINVCSRAAGHQRNRFALTKIPLNISPTLAFSATKKQRKGKASQRKGIILEKRVAKIFEQEGKRNIQRNVILKDRHGNRSEIDVVFDTYPSWSPWKGRKYVECKNYVGSVPLEDVAKFKAVLELNGIDDSKGIFVTTSKFSPRCAAHAGNIQCIDGDELKRWEKRVRRKEVASTIYWWPLQGAQEQLGSIGWLRGVSFPHFDQKVFCLYLH